MGPKDDAASDVVGTTLLVAITVVAAAGFAFFTLSMPGPIHGPDVDVAFALSPGSNGWATGDEQIILTHRGGPALTPDATAIIVHVGDGVTRYGGTTLQSAFADGRFTIGERWTLTLNLSQDTRVSIDLVSDGGSGSILLATSVLTPAADAPVTPPPPPPPPPPPSPTLTYVTSNTTIRGTIVGFADLKAEDGVDGKLAEGGVATMTQFANYTSNIILSSDFQTVSVALINRTDATYATDATSSAARTIHAGFADEPGSPGTIQSVIVRARGSITGFSNDGFSLRACMGPLVCSAGSGFIASSASDIIHSHDVTALHPTGNATWTWSDINALTAQISTEKLNNADGTWRVDQLWIQVTYGPVAYAMDIQMGITGVPTGTTQTLELKYHVVGDTFHVQVWNGTTWNTRGATLTSATSVAWTYPLAGAEYNAGTPRIRFIDVQPAGTTQGQLFLDHVRVRTE